MENVADCVAQVNNWVRGLQDSDTRLNRHLLEVLQTGIDRHMQGYVPSFERLITTTVRSAAGGSIEVSRQIDVIARDLLSQIHTEVKTGGTLSSVFKPGQLEQDAALAIDNLQRNVAQKLENVWRLADVQFRTLASGGLQVPPTLAANLNQTIMRLVQEKFTFQELRAAMGSFSFVDAAGRVIKTEMSEKGELIFRDAMGVLLGTDGSMAKVALSAASNSPNFQPAMDVLFGASGKLADAVHDQAVAANLDPALETLEDKIEQGVGDALEEAGTKAANQAGQTLGASVAAGATAMGNILTSVPQLYDSVGKLGEAWDKPLNSTKAYMDLFAATGAVINQGVQVFQAFAGVTQIASAAQAVFNAVMAMNPVVLIVLAVIALIAAIAALIIYWDQVKAALRDNPWLAVAAVLFGIIGIIIVIIAYWDEIKLAVLRAANFVSIQVQRIGAFFVGLGNLIGQVWDWIVGTASNAGIAVLNFFITVGTQIQNFFIGLVNGILELYNEVATSAVGEFIGLEPAELIPEVAVETRLIPPREVPEISVQAAFAGTGPITGGLEGQIAAQEQVVAQARQEDEARRQRDRDEAAQRERQAAPPALPAGVPPALPTGAAAGLPAAGALPGGAAAAAGAGAGMAVRVEGGITINLNAERMELDAAEVLTDEIVQRLRERLEALGSEAAFRTGARQTAAA
jgi:hypothetical protein